jgi:hypothetical protein
MNQKKHVHGSKKNSRISQDFRSYITQRSEKKESKGTNLRLLFRAREKREKREKKRRIEIVIGCKFGVEDCCSKKKLLLQQGTHSTSADGLPKRTKDYIVLATISFWKQKTNQAREGKIKFSVSLSLSLASQFLKTLLAAAFEASSARKLATTTIRDKSKLTRSPALLSLSLSLSLCAASCSASFGKP